MSAPVLSVLEQRASISGKRKNRKTKNVLNIPKDPQFQSQLIQTVCVKKLTKILERLLPTARLPFVKVEDANENATNETQLKAEAKNKRNQLSLGVNSLSRSIKNDLLSAVLIADNIQPKFLIYHINLLCSHKKVPFLLMPGLREIIKNSLGFPCIAVGFKKDFDDFSKAVEEIKSISQSNKITSNEVTLDCESDEEEIISGENYNVEKSDEKEMKFTYLYRTSKTERIFLPEKSGNDESQEKQNTGFIDMQKFDTESNYKNNSCQQGFSVRNKKQMKKLKKFEDFKNSKTDDKEDLRFPKKKSKKDFHKKAEKKIRYFPANLMKVPLNSDRIKKNK